VRRATFMVADIRKPSQQQKWPRSFDQLIGARN
jgi:hypothetical protein